jgi:hypothetical protein
MYETLYDPNFPYFSIPYIFYIQGYKVYKVETG